MVDTEIVIDPARCAGHLLCTFLLPELFEPDDDGRGRVRAVSIPPELLDGAREAANNCPTQAIVLTEVTP